MKESILRKILVRNEGPKLDFKREYKISNPPPNVNNADWQKLKQGQFDELTKDIIALTNGNLNQTTLNETAYLIIGADDEKDATGAYPICDARHIQLNAKDLLNRVNGACEVALPDLDCELIEIDGQGVWVISIPPTPIVLTTKRELKPITGKINPDGTLGINPKNPYPKGTTFIRTGEGTRIASPNECTLLANMKKAFATSAIRIPKLTLPSVLPDFIGRQAEYEQILDYLQKPRLGAGRILVTGMGGIGKSQFAIWVAHQLKGKFFDDVVYFDLNGDHDQPLEMTEVLKRIILKFTPTERLPESSTELIDIFRELSQAHSVLYVFDNAWHNNQLLALMPSGDESAVIIASREKLTLAGFFNIELKLLELSEARQLMCAICPRLNHWAGTQFSKDGLVIGVVEQLAELCGKLPLTVRAAASTLANHTDIDHKKYIQELTDEKHRLKLLGTSNSVDEQDIHACLELSYVHLSALQKKLLARLSVFPGSFDRPAAISICTDKKGAALSDLVNANLVDFDAEHNRYQLHALMRLFAVQKCDATEREQIACRHARYFAKVLTKCNTLYQRNKRLIALALFDLERHNIVAGQAWSVAEENLEFLFNTNALELWHLYADYPYVIDERLPLEMRRDWKMQGRLAGTLLGQPDWESVHIGNFGIDLLESGHYAEAIDELTSAIKIARKVGNLHNQKAWLLRLGDAWSDLDNYHKAATYYRQALKLAVQGKDRSSQAIALNGLGLISAEQKKYPQAIRFYQQALSADKSSEMAMHIYNNLGVAHAHIEQTTEANGYYERSLNLANKLKRLDGQANVFGNLANLKRSTGEYQVAIDYARRDLELRNPTINPYDYAVSLAILAEIYADQQQYTDAIKYGEQSLAVFARLKTTDQKKMRVSLRQWRKQAAKH